MTTQNTQTKKTEGENGKKPDWVVKTPRGRGEKSRLERVGVAWSRDDGGICLRLIGKQIIDNDVYLYTMGGDVAEGDAQ